VVHVLQLRPEWVSPPPVIHGHCRELRSARMGTADWNVLAAELAGKVRTAPPRRRPHRDQLNHVLGLRPACHADRLTVAARDGCDWSRRS